MTDPEQRRQRRERQAAEIEASQARLRKSISDTQRLMDESDEMLKRHRKERDAEDED